MPEAFDPYLRWLGIRDPGRPPNHYRLLGLDLFENDSDVIAVAADRQMAHVRTFQTGQFAALSQRVLNELAVARICLLKPEKKAVYDALLKKQMGAAVVAVRAKPQSDTTPMSVAAHPVVVANDANAVAGNEGAAEDSFDFASISSAKGTSRRAISPSGRKSAAGKLAVPAVKSKSLAPWIGLAIAGLLLVVGVIAVQQMGASPEVATTERSKNAVTAATSTPVSPGSVPPKADASKKSASAAVQSHRPDPAIAPADHGSAATPADVRPTASQFAPNGSPPEPPVHSPSDVIHVENPAQSDPLPSSPAKPVAGAPTEVVQVDAGTPSSSDGRKTNGHGPQTQSTPNDPATDSKPKRTPVPSKDQINAAEAKVQKLFNVSAAKRPDERAALTKTLYAQGIDPNNQDVDRYVLLRLAVKDAAALGDVELATQAANKLAETFDVNTFEEKTALLSTLTKTVRTPAAAESLVLTAETLLSDSLDANEFDSAKEVSLLAAGLAAKAANPAQAKEFRQRGIEIDHIRKEFATASAARDSLKSKPDDPEANYVWGYFLGPIKGDFEKALPFLANSNNDALQALAKKELAKPTDASAQAELADAWSSFAEKSKPGEKANIQSHAAGLYKLALPNLKGIARTAAEQKLAQIDGEKKQPGARIHMDPLTRVLTAGTWHIQWSSGNTWDVKFFADHTARFGKSSGTWTAESGLVQCRWNDQPNTSQTIRVLSDRLEVEAYAGGTKNNTGIGRLASP